MCVNVMQWLSRWRRGVSMAAVRACFLAVLGFLASVAPLQAAIVAPGDVSPALPWNNNTVAYVGATAGGTLSVNGGSQLSTAAGYLGYYSGATGAATITGSGSLWSNSGLYVGRSGSGALNVASGGQVNSSVGYLGYNAGASGVATISGSGSKWINAFADNLYVGYSGSGTLNVTSGGQVNSTNSYAYLGYNSGASGAATISGPGSMWTNSSNFYVGQSGSGTLNVASGGQVSCGNGYLGLNGGASGVATIAGTGSSWNNSGEFYVGYSGSGTLTVATGGQVTAATLYASLGDLYGNGTITATKGAVLDADLRFDASHGPKSVIPFGSGGTLTVTASGSDLGAGYKGRGSLTITNGVSISSYDGYLGLNSGASGVATISGPGSKWTISGGLYVGGAGSGTLSVADGGQVTTATLFASLGDLYGNGTIYASQGAVLDADWRFDSSHGPVSSFSFGSSGILSVGVASGDLGVGYKGQGSLTVADGVAVNSGYGYLGYKSGAAGVATISGPGSKWTIANDLYVGYLGSGTLNVSNGGQVTAATLYASLGDLYGNGTITAQGALLDADLRFDASHRTRAVIPFGSGGTLTVSTSGGDLGAGYKGRGSIIVADGVAITDGLGYLGYNSGASGVATITGSGSMWTNSFDLYIGIGGSGTLNVASGGQVNTTSSAYLGLGSAATGMATISGAGAKWTSSGDINIGYYGSGALNVASGGQVNGHYAYLGYNSGATGLATITSSGSTWTNSINLNVGYSGSGTLNIASGGQVISGASYLGYYSGATGLATITGSGSQWNSGNFNVGYSGGGTLNVDSGGQVSSSFGYLGYNLDGTGLATISGSGSKWNNSSSVYVGYSGKGTLRVADGGQVTTSGLYVGRSSSGSLNVADGGQITTKTLYASLSDLYGNGTITATQGAVLDADWRFDASHGSKSTFSFGSGGTLTVTASGGGLGAGYKGRGSLTVADGVTISSGAVYLGYYSGASGVATISGAGSKWTNSGYLYVGDSGSGTLNVASGGQVNNTIFESYLGYYSGASGVATIAGAGSKWTCNALYVGNSGSSTLNVASSGQLNSSYGYLGYAAGASGVATISGSGSKWTNSGLLNVGNSGSGTLNVASGGQVNNSTYGYLGYSASASGVATISGSGSKWTTADLYVGASGSGTLTVADGGQVSNSDNGGLGWFPGASGVATITGSGSQWTSGFLYVGYSGSGALNVASAGQVNSSSLMVGYSSSGTLNIGSGGQVNSTYGYLGDNSGATGVATITGSTSKWTNTGSFGGPLYVGYSGSGTLTAADGGQVSNHYDGYLGLNSGASGVATITGSGSKWTNDGSLCIGNSGSGTVRVSGGGQVTAGSVSVNSRSLVAIDVGNGSALSVKSGTGTITNNGKARFTAAAGAAVGQYRPIAATTFTGSGAYTAIGGTWDPTGHVFTVSSPMMAASGMPVTLDLASQQRLLVSDSQSGWSVGASLMAKTGSASLASFTATAMPDSSLDPLTMQFDADESLLGAWQFSLGGSGYSAGDPVYLSFPVADGTPLSYLQVWHWDGTDWTAFPAGDLNVGQGYANFTATSFSGYAVSAVVPEPSTLALLSMGAIGLLAYSRWRGRAAERKQEPARSIPMPTFLRLRRTGVMRRTGVRPEFTTSERGVGIRPELRMRRPGPMTPLAVGGSRETVMDVGSPRHGTNNRPAPRNSSMSMRKSRSFSKAASA